MGAVKTLLTFDEFEQLPDAEAGESLELLDGEIIQLPPPQKRHMQGSHELYKRLDRGLELARQSSPQIAGCKVYMEMGYLMPGRRASWFWPDVSVTWPNQPGDRYYEQSPMIAIEIVSEHDRAKNIERKVAKYLEHGAAEGWAVYPESRHAVVHTARGIERKDKAFSTELLPGIEIPFDEFL